MKLVVCWWKARWVCWRRLCHICRAIWLDVFYWRLSWCFMNLIDFVTVLYCDYFVRIQKVNNPAEEYLTAIITFFYSNFGIGKCLGAFYLGSAIVLKSRRLLYRIQFSSHVIMWSRNGSVLLHMSRFHNFSLFRSIHMASIFQGSPTFSFGSNIRKMLQYLHLAVLKAFKQLRKVFHTTTLMAE